MFYIQFNEVEAMLYTEEEWLDGPLQANMRRARIRTRDSHHAQRVFATLRNACAGSSIPWEKVSKEVEEF